MSTKSILSAMSAKIEEIGVKLAKRDEYLRLAAEIDAEVLEFAQKMGLDNDYILSVLPTTAPPRLAREDRRSEGTMSAKMLDILFHADRGMSRTDLRHELEKVDTFRQQLNNNVNSFYNNVNRYLKKEKIVEVDGLLYHPDRAPLPDGKEDPSGQHLSSNVSNLFQTVGRRPIDFGQ